MTTRSEKHQAEKAIAEYVATYGVTNTRDIAEYVESILGFYPSTGTVSKILQDLGYLPHRQPSFVWRHNPGKGE